MQAKESRRDAKQGRVVGLVIAISMVVWILAQALGPYLGLPGRYAILIDFLALVAFLWAIISGMLMWRSRRTNGKEK